MSLSIKQKKEWAKTLYVREHMSQKDVAEKVGISKVTMNKWVKDGDWNKLRQSLLITRDEQLRRLYMQLDELNTAIMEREPGKRFAEAKEADTISKLTNSIKRMETEASVADVVEVSKKFLDWLRPIAPTQAKDIANVMDEFIKHLLKRS